MPFRLLAAACAAVLCVSSLGCDRRAAEPVDESQADNPTYMATDAASPNASPAAAEATPSTASPAVNASPGTAAPAPVPTDSACAGLTGTAAEDCARRAAPPATVEVPDPPAAEG